MLQVLNIVLLVLLLTTALAASLLHDLLVVVIIFSSYSLIMVVIWQMMHAPDLALTEIAVGAGITTVLFIITIFKTQRREK